MRFDDLTVLILEHIGTGAMEHAFATGGDGGRMQSAVQPVTAGFDTRTGASMGAGPSPLEQHPQRLGRGLSRRAERHEEGAQHRGVHEGHRQPQRPWIIP